MTEYKRVDVMTVKGIETAEKLKANGWQIAASSPFSIQFYKRTPRTYWNVTQGTSRARVLANTYEQALERAAQIGFKKPDSVVLETR
jgi:hypothetical protein